MALELICMAFLVMLFGLAIAFFGYRLFLVLLPVWGFFLGFGVGAQAMTALFGYGFLSTVTSWVVGAIVGIVFGILSYLFYWVGVALISASIGYVLGIAVMDAIGIQGALAFLVGFAAAVLVAFIVLRWNWQKYAIIIVSGLTGAAISTIGLLLPFGVFDLEDFASGAPVKSMLSESPFWILFWLLLALLAIIVQWRAGRKVDLFAQVTAVPAEPSTRAPEPITPAVSSAAPEMVAGAAIGAAAATAQAPEEPLPVTAEVAPPDEPEVMKAPDTAMAAATLSQVEMEEKAPEEIATPAEAPVEEVLVSKTEEAESHLEGLDLTEEQTRYLKRDLEYVEGIGPVYAGKLNALGLKTAYDLLSRGATRKGRAEISEQSGITGTLILKWVNHADLFRLKGVGSEYADLLEATGVDTVVELANRNPLNLFNKMLEINTEKNLVRHLPTEEQVADWIAQAKNMPRIITY